MAIKVVLSPKLPAPLVEIARSLLPADFDLDGFPRGGACGPHVEPFAVERLPVERQPQTAGGAVDHLGRADVQPDGRRQRRLRQNSS